MNGTDFGDVIGDSISELTMATLVFTLIFSSLAAVFNSFLLLILLCDPFREFRTPSTVFVANLAVADLLTGFFSILKTTIILTNGLSTIYNTGWIVASSGIWTMQCSLFTVLLITGERLLAVSKPLHFRSLVTSRRTLLLSISTWVLSLLNCSASTFANDKTFYFSFLFTSIFNFIAVILTVLGYFVLYKALKNKNNEINRYAVPDNSQTSTTDTASLRRKKKAFSDNKKLVNTFLMVTVVMILTVLPVSILAIIFVFCPWNCGNIINIIFKYEPLVMINFVVNPIIYAFRLPQYRKAFWSVIRCARPSNVVRPGL